jgi:uncharacterized DUF497 family protein
MKYEWDPRKNRLNRQNHKLDFADARLIFEQPMLVKKATSYEKEQYEQAYRNEFRRA